MLRPALQVAIEEREQDSPTALPVNGLGEDDASDATTIRKSASYATAGSPGKRPEKIYGSC